MGSVSADKSPGRDDSASVCSLRADVSNQPAKALECPGIDPISELLGLTLCLTTVVLFLDNNNLRGCHDPAEPASFSNLRWHITKVLGRRQSSIICNCAANKNPQLPASACPECMVADLSKCSLF